MHGEFTALMSLVLDDEASQDQIASLRHHIARCDECAAVWRGWQGLDAQLSSAPPVAPPLDLVSAVSARLAEQRTQSVQQRLLASGLLVVWIGVVCLLWAGGIGLLWWGYNHPVEVSLAISSWAQALSSATLLLKGVQNSLFGLREPSLAVGLAGYACLTMTLLGLWFWAAMLGSGKQHSSVRATGSRQAS